jgi:LysR family hydrogen peroxide-inducible transcriptional activator
MSRSAAPYPFTLRQAQYAVVLAETKSFGRAAERCHVSQPSLSAQLAELERGLGVRLFERDRRSVRVSRAGAELLPRLKALTLAADELLAASTATQDPFALPLKLGIIPTIAPYLLPEVLPRLRKKLPLARILWSEEKTSSVLERVINGELDGGVVATDEDEPGLKDVVLGKDPFVLAAPRGHALAGDKRRAQLSDLEGESVVLLEEGHCFRDQALQLCARGKAEELDVRATSLGTLSQLVSLGAGVTLLPKLALQTEVRRGELVIREFGAPSPSRTIRLLWRKGSSAEKPMQLLAPLLADAVTARLR